MRETLFELITAILPSRNRKWLPKWVPDWLQQWFSNHCYKPFYDRCIEPLIIARMTRDENLEQTVRRAYGAVEKREWGRERYKEFEQARPWIDRTRTILCITGFSA